MNKFSILKYLICIPVPGAHLQLFSQGRCRGFSRDVGVQPPGEHEEAAHGREPHLTDAQLLRLPLSQLKDEPGPVEFPILGCMGAGAYGHLCGAGDKHGDRKVSAFTL